MDRARKAAEIEGLKSVFAGAGAVVVTHYSGLSVAEMTELRTRLRREGAQFKVVKNTLVQKALDGSVGEAGAALFTGPVAIAFGPDAVSAAKIVTQYAKDNDKLKLIGGILGQTTVLDETAVRSLAAMPSLDQLRSQLLGLLQAPATRLARVLSEPSSQIARVLQAHVDRNAA